MALELDRSMAAPRHGALDVAIEAAEDEREIKSFWSRCLAWRTAARRDFLTWYTRRIPQQSEHKIPEENTALIYPIMLSIEPNQLRRLYLLSPQRSEDDAAFRLLLKAQTEVDPRCQAAAGGPHEARSEPHLPKSTKPRENRNPKPSATLELVEFPGLRPREERQTEWTALENWAKSGKDSDVTAVMTHGLGFVVLFLNDDGVET